LSDDGAKLFINDKNVINNDGTHGFLEAGGSIKLAKGDYNFKLQFFQGPRYEAGLQLFVKREGSKEAIFPGSEIELVSESGANSLAKQ
jgi:hypothetical protein